MSQRTPPWRKRQEIPDPQVLDAANQYEAARRLLAAQPPGSGFLLPLMSVAAVAIELYLKCLSAEVVHTAAQNGWSVVSSAPAMQSHKLTALLEALPADVREVLERAFQSGCPGCGGLSLRDALANCEGAFVASRYPFEQGTDISRYPLALLMGCSEFLARYVGSLETGERIEWS